MRRNNGKLTQQLPRLAAGLAPLGGWRARSAISSSSPFNLLTLTACHAAHWCDAVCVRSWQTVAAIVEGSTGIVHFDVRAHTLSVRRRAPSLTPCRAAC